MATKLFVKFCSLFLVTILNLLVSDKQVFCETTNYDDEGTAEDKNGTDRFGFLYPPASILVPQPPIIFPPLVVPVWHPARPSPVPVPFSNSNDDEKNEYEDLEQNEENGEENEQMCGRRYANARSSDGDDTSKTNFDLDRSLADESTEEFDDSQFMARIVGGRVTTIDRWPWQVSITYYGVHVCGGSLIDKWHIVTAAHCFQVSKTPSDFSVHLGRSHLISKESSQVERKVSHIAVHENYNKIVLDSDIALIRLKRPVEFSSTISPICLPPNENVILADGTPCFVTGFGDTRETGGDDSLKEAAITVISNKKCKKLTGKVFEKLLTSKMFCAGALAGGTDSCKGDSGGPLVAETRRGSQQFVLHGVVSFGIDCGQPNLPGIYVRTAKFLKWIQGVVARWERGN